MRTLVVGDIHGGLRALKQVLEKAGVTEADRLIFLGDYVDGWSEAAETVDFLIELKNKYSCIYLRGNHDELTEGWLQSGRELPLWVRSGGQATMDSYEDIELNKKNIHLQFYSELHNYFLDEENRLYLHAGFTNEHGVGYEYFSKSFYWDRTLWELALAIDPNLKQDDPYYPRRLKHYREIYIGHTPLSRIGKTKPLKAANVWNIDTGAALKGPLTIFDADSKEFWQSDPVFQLYPDELGRNRN